MAQTNGFTAVGIDADDNIVIHSSVDVDKFVTIHMTKATAEIMCVEMSAALNALRIRDGKKGY